MAKCRSDGGDDDNVLLIDFASNSKPVRYKWKTEKIGANGIIQQSTRRLNQNKQT